MSNNKLITGEGVFIGRDHWDVPVRVELAPDLRFSRRLDAPVAPASGSLGTYRVPLRTWSTGR